MATGKEPCHQGAPVMAGHVGLRTPEGLDDGGDILDQVIDRVVFHTLRRIAEPVASKIWRHGEVTRSRERVYLFRPGLGAFGEAVEEDEHLAGGRSIDHGSEAKAVRLDHVLRRGHLQLLRMNSVATSRAWSSTLSSPCPWPLKISSRDRGTSLTYCFKRSRRANGSRSPLRNRVGQRIAGRCSMRSWSVKPGR